MKYMNIIDLTTTDEPYYIKLYHIVAYFFNISKVNICELYIEINISFDLKIKRILFEQ